MSKSIINTIIFLFLFTSFSVVCYAAELEKPFDTPEVRAIVEELKPGIIGLKDDNEKNQEIKNFFIELAQDDPELVNKIFDLPLVKESFLGKLIEDTNLKLKVFEPEEEGKSASLGFSYSYNKNHKSRFDKESENYSGLDIAFKAKGNVAFDNDANPKDFLDTKLSWSYFLSRGGVFGVIDDGPTLTKLNELETKIAMITEAQELRTSKDWADYKKIIGKHLSDQYYFDIGLDGGLESDQSFKKKQYTYGAKAGLVARGWGDDSILGLLNVLDYIPALIRQYSAIDDKWRPRGSAFPSVLLGVDQVMPEGDDPRAQAGDDSDFPRFKVEASFKTLFAEWKTDPVYLEANFRFYHEFSASQAVKDAKLDEFTFFSIALRLPQNIFVSYSTGKLPLNEADSQVYSIGLDYNF